MIASWMLYAALIGILLSLAAVAAERALTARGKPTRFVWVAAIVLSVGWPLAPAVARLLPAPPRPVSILPFTIVVQPITISAGEIAALHRAQVVDRALMGLWVTLSLLLLARLVHGASTLERRRSAWKRSRVNGVRVRLSDNVGPAVVGLRSMEVVLPEWILALDESLRALVLCHEEEHRRAGDPFLLLGAAIAVVLMPWNAALWVQARRLRLAIEMDCDARVLRAHPSPERYGMLILTIAQRRSTAPALFAPMLSEPTTNLERRILAMRTKTRRMGKATMYGGGMITITLLALASTLQCARESSPAAPADAAATARVSQPARIDADRAFFDFQVEKQVSSMPGNGAPRYPDILRKANIEGEVLAQFVVDPDGRPDMSTFKVLRSSHDLFTNTVVKALPNMRFYPAQVGGRPVRQVVQMPFQFSLTKN